MRSWPTCGPSVPAWGRRRQPRRARGRRRGPEWPCVQRLVPEIAPAVIWPGPPLDLVAAAPSPAIDAAGRGAGGAPGALGEAEAQIDHVRRHPRPGAEGRAAHAPVRPHARPHQSRPHLDHPGHQEVRPRRARSGRARSARSNEQLSRAAGGPGPGARDSDRRARAGTCASTTTGASSLAYLCEQPVLLDQRAFALARAIAESSGIGPMHRSSDPRVLAGAC